MSGGFVNPPGYGSGPPQQPPQIPNQGQVPYPQNPTYPEGPPSMSPFGYGRGSPYPPEQPGPGYPTAQQPSAYPPNPGFPGSNPSPGYPSGAQPSVGYPPTGPNQYPPYGGGGGQFGGSPYGSSPMPPTQAGYPPMSGGYPPSGQGAFGTVPGGQAPTYIPPGNASQGMIEISASCTNLRDMDYFSKSDPMCVMYKDTPAGWVEVGRTEMLVNNHNPSWMNKFTVENLPQQRVKFQVFDFDMRSNRLKDQDSLGYIETNLGSLINGQFSAKLLKGKGMIYLNGKVMNPNNDILRIQFGASKLEDKDAFGKSDPFFIISKNTGGGRYNRVYQSEVLNNNLNPVWSPAEINVRELCDGDYERELKFQVFDYDKGNNNDVIGEFTTNLTSLVTAVANQRSFVCINPRKTGHRSYKNSGTVYVKFSEIRPRY